MPMPLNDMSARPSLGLSLIQTLVLYALAEHQGGHARQIQVQARGHCFEIEDDGRGHALARTVEGAPYLRLIYQHLDLPLQGGPTPPVQLQGLGMSLLNRLCAELEVTVHKADATLALAFAHGQLLRHELLPPSPGRRGNRLAGRVDAGLSPQPVDEAELGQWLRQIQAGSPGVALFFNGERLAVDSAG